MVGLLVCWFVFLFICWLVCLFYSPFLIEKIVSKCKSDCCILMFFILYYREQCDREQALDDFKTAAVFMYILKLLVLKALSILISELVQWGSLHKLYEAHTFY